MKSSTTVKMMADQIKAELSSYQTLSDNIIYMAYNSVIGKLYRGVIKEVRYTLKSVTQQGETQGILLGDIGYEDIVSIRSYLGEFKKVSMEFSKSFPMTYYLTKNGEGQDVVSIDCEDTPEQVQVYYYYIPATVNGVNAAETNIPITEEYLPMIYAYVRGECYKWVNEDALAAKWLNDYNAQLTGFAAWINELKKEIGT